MSLCDAHLSRIATAGAAKASPAVCAWAKGAAATALLGALLAGCGDGGFRPMYASTATGQPLEEKLAAVETAPIGGRVGQRVRNELIFQNTGGGNPAPPAYRLEIAIKESLSAALVRTTGESTSSIYTLDASFTLVDIKSKQVILRGTSHARAAFDRFPSIYSNVRAREDAENRAAKDMANELKGRIAAFLSNSKV